MKAIGYIRVSTNSQETKNQRHEILEYAHRNKLKINEFVEIEISSRKDLDKRRINETLEKLCKGDILIVSELSRLGRSTAEVLNIVNYLVDRHIRFVSIKQNIDINGERDMTSKVMVTMFSLFAELERDLISERTKQALATRRSAGVKLGRPKGSLGKHILDDKVDEIKKLLSLKVSKASIAKICGVPRSTLIFYLKSRHLL